MNLSSSILILTLPVIAAGLLTFKIRISDTGLKLLLAYSAAYLLALSFLHLLPEIFEGEGNEKAGIFILAGFFIQLLIDYFSTGIEHGHMHHHEHEGEHSHKSHVPVSVLAGLFLHSFIEGLPVSDLVVHEHAGSFLGFKQSLVIGITLHNIPIALAFMLLMKHNGLSKAKSLFYLTLFSLMAPLGACFSEFLHLNGFAHFDTMMKIALGIVVGIFLHISTTIMFESGENHKYNVAKLVSILGGTLTALFIS